MRAVIISETVLSPKRMIPSSISFSSWASTRVSSNACESSSTDKLALRRINCLLNLAGEATINFVSHAKARISAYSILLEKRAHCKTSLYAQYLGNISPHNSNMTDKATTTPTKLHTIAISGEKSSVSEKLISIATAILANPLTTCTVANKRSGVSSRVLINLSCGEVSSSDCKSDDAKENKDISDADTKPMTNKRNNANTRATTTPPKGASILNAQKICDNKYESGSKRV